MILTHFYQKLPGNFERYRLINGPTDQQTDWLTDTASYRLSQKMLICPIKIKEVIFVQERTFYLGVNREIG